MQEDDDSGEVVILRLEGVDDRNGAEALRGKNLYIDRKDMWEMPEDTYHDWEELNQIFLSQLE